MSLQADVFTYWDGNSTLTTAIPSSRFYAGIVPQNTPFPYAVLVPLSSVPSYVTKGHLNGYVEDFQFQISIYDTNPDNALDVANIVVQQFEGQSISAACMTMLRVNGPVFVVETGTPALVYHCWIQFDYQANVT